MRTQNLQYYQAFALSLNGLQKLSGPAWTERIDHVSGRTIRERETDRLLTSLILPTDRQQTSHLIDLISKSRRIISVVRLVRPSRLTESTWTTVLLKCTPAIGAVKACTRRLLMINTPIIVRQTVRVEGSWHWTLVQTRWCSYYTFAPFPCYDLFEAMGESPVFVNVLVEKAGDCLTVSTL